MKDVTQPATVSSGRWRQVPSGVWALGVTSLFMDTSSELIHSLLPVFLATTLGASTMTIGLIEGVAEASTTIAKLFSGALSDYLAKRKFLVVLGYALGAVTKPFFPLATSASWVFAARFVDRIGKGIRGAPRDALVADVTPPELRGAAFGLRQSLDTVGAVLGPLLALVLMAVFAGDIRAVFWAATLPACAAVFVLVAFVREPDGVRRPATWPPIVRAELRRLPSRYWAIVALGSVISLARFSEAFLVLRATSVGLTAAQAPLVLIVMNVVYALAAYPAGVAADRMSQRALLAVGVLVLIGSDIALASASGVTTVLTGVGLWGLHMGLTQGLFSSLVAATAPATLRGTAFGLYNLITGMFVLVASLLAGTLWSQIAPSATFWAGAVFATTVLVGMVFWGPQLDDAR